MGGAEEGIVGGRVLPQIEKSSPCHIPASGGRMTPAACGPPPRASSLATLVSSESRLAPTRSGSLQSKRAAGTGLALADDLPGHPDHHRARRDGLDHDGIGADPAVLADLDRTEDLGPGADDHAVTDGGMAFPANHATAAESDAVIDRDVVADLRGFSDHHAGRVVDEHASTDDGTGVDIYTGQDASEFGSCPREQPGATLPQPVGEAVAPHGVHARVAEDDFQRGRGRRIPLPGCSDVAPHGRQHGLVSHVGEQRCAQISFAEVGEHYDD